MNILVNFVRLLGLLGEPYMPGFSAKLYEIMNVNYDEVSSTLLGRIVSFKNGVPEMKNKIILGLIIPGHKINEPQPLFRKSKIFLI